MNNGGAACQSSETAIHGASRLAVPGGSASADHHPGFAAQAAFVLAALEAVGAGQFTRGMIGMVQDTEAQRVGETGITYRRGREAHHEFLHVLKYCHLPLPL